MRNQRFWNNFIIGSLIVVTVLFLWMMVVSGKYDRVLVTLSFFFVLWIPRIIRKIFKINIPDRLEFIYLIYVFGAHFLGSIVGLYSSVYWFDALIHFISGILASFVGLYVLCLFHKYKKNELWFPIFFMVCFSVMVAGCWEFLEFFCDLILGGNVQHALDTGVRDTMEDMLVATLGSLLIVCLYGYEVSCEKNGIFWFFMRELEGVKDGK